MTESAGSQTAMNTCTYLHINISICIYILCDYWPIHGRLLMRAVAPRPRSRVRVIPGDGVAERRRRHQRADQDPAGPSVHAAPPPLIGAPHPRVPLEGPHPPPPMPLPFAPPLPPMLSKLSDELPPAGEWLYEPKWDGFRALVFRDEMGLQLQSRDERMLARYF